MAGKGKGVLRIAIEDFLETFTFGKIISKWFTEWGEEQETAISESFDDVLSQIADIDELPDVLKRLIEGGDMSGLQGGILTAGGFAASAGMGAASAILAPIMRIINYTMDSAMRTARVDPGLGWAMIRRSPGTVLQIKKGMRQLGYSDLLIDAFDELTKPVLGELDLITIYRRDNDRLADVVTELTRQGWSPSRIDDLFDLSKIIPGVSDLIGMATREAFDDAVAGQFGYDENFPAELGENAAKQGLSIEWSKRYWRAHWQLPSVGQGFEMLHRLRPGVADNVMSKGDLDLLLRALDIPSFWRDRLTELSYRPLTRVDVRRMYGFGVLGEDDVLNAYLDLGYNAANAKRMTDFTIAYESGAEKELTKAAIIKGFKRAVYTASEATSALVEMGYSSDAADFYVAMAELELLDDEIDLELDFIEAQFISGEISESQVYDFLGPLNISTEQGLKLVKKWQLAKSRKIRLPSESELETFYKSDIISQAQYKAGLVARNYKAESLNWYIIQADTDISKQTALELERTQKEHARLATSEVVDQYRLDIAGLDVKIASFKYDISNLKVAAHQTEDESIIDQIKFLIATIKADIANLNLEKAELRLELEG